MFLFGVYITEVSIGVDVFVWRLYHRGVWLYIFILCVSCTYDLMAYFTIWFGLVWIMVFNATINNISVISHILRVSNSYP